MYETNKQTKKKYIDSFFVLFKVKSDGQNTRTWCKRRGVEEQRLYDITKLRRQFQDILRV